VTHPVAAFRAFLDELPVTLAVMDIALGCVLLFGGSHRVSGPGFAAAKTVAPIPTWGAVLAFLAIGAAYHLWRGHHTGMWFVLCAAWLGFFAATLIRSAVLSDNVALTGIVLFTFSVIVHLQAARQAG
jgi:hypothetical protein